MRYMRFHNWRYAACMLALLAGASAQAEMPAEAQLRADLAGPFAVAPARPVLPHRGEVARRLEPLMTQQARYLIDTLRPWEKEPEARLLTSGKSGEHDIRPNAHTASGLAVLARTPDAKLPQGLSHEACRDEAIGLLRFLLPTHGAGGVTLADGKLWGGQWQSALWAEIAGRAAWLLWDDIDPALRWLAARMVADEADRFLGKDPPAQIANDTKAEENAWNASVMTLAYSMFPRHPRAAQWRETAIRWQLSAYLRQADNTANPTVDGRPVREWNVGANLYDDYTLENHGRVHPDYMCAMDLNVYQVQPPMWTGKMPAEASTFNTRGVYSSLKWLAFPDGGWVYPNGQDWHLRRNPDWLATAAEQAVLQRDPQAARILRFTLETVERLAARNPEDGVYLPGESFFASTQHFVLDSMSRAYLLLREMGEGPKPVSEKSLWKDLSGTRIFAAGKFGVTRTPRSVATFSWGAQVMGLVVPIQDDLLLAPNERSFIGNIIGPDGKPDRPQVLEARVTPMEDALAVCGVLRRAGGAVEQRFGFLALPDGRAVYVDIASLTGEARPRAIDLGTLTLLNDPNWIYGDARRTVAHVGGRQDFVGSGGSEAPVAFRSSWVNLDGVLGVACLSTSGRQVYTPAQKPVRARIEQTLALSHIEPEMLNAGPLPPTVLVFYPGQDAAATARLAGACRLSREGDTLTVTLDDGKRARFDLAKLAIERD